MVILDTCAVIESCYDSPSFSSACLARIEKRAYVLSASFAEIALKEGQKKLQMNISTEELVSRYREISTVVIVDIGCQEWLDAIRLDWRHRDPVDRLLVGFAKRNDLTIITTDKKIKKYYKQVLW